MLIRYPTQTARDLAHWRVLERQDAVHCRLTAFRRRAEKAVEDLRRFAAAGPCWVGVSWGKESTIVAHLAAALHAQGVEVPVIWFRPRPNAMPACDLVRDTFLARWPIDYREVDCEIPLLDSGEWGIDEGYDPHWHAYHREHPRHVLGLRADESRARRLRARLFGVSTANTCAPLSFWTGADVFAYLYAHELPVHPTYAMSIGGAIERERLRVAALGGDPGRGFGRAEWEERYYGAALREARAAARPLEAVRADQAKGLCPALRMSTSA